MSTNHDNPRAPVSVPMPADVEKPDAILFGLSARPLALIGGTAAGVWLGWQATRAWLPPTIAAALAGGVLAIAIAVAIIRRDGVSLDVWLMAAARHALARAGRRGRGHPSDGRDREPAPWTDAIDDDGTLAFGGGYGLVVECQPVNFALRTPAEQQALMTAVARWLHQLTNGVQILVRAHRLDLAVLADDLDTAIGHLPSPALQQAAAAHADMITDLAVRRQITHRRVFVVLRGSDRVQVEQHADDTIAALAAAEVDAWILDGPQARTLLTPTLATDTTPDPPAATPVRVTPVTRPPTAAARRSTAPTAGAASPGGFDERAGYHPPPPRRHRPGGHR